MFFKRFRQKIFELIQNFGASDVWDDACREYRLNIITHVVALMCLQNNNKNFLSIVNKTGDFSLQKVIRATSVTADASVSLYAHMPLPRLIECLRACIDPGYQHLCSSKRVRNHNLYKLFFINVYHLNQNFKN